MNRKQQFDESGDADVSRPISTAIRTHQIAQNFGVCVLIAICLLVDGALFGEAEMIVVALIGCFVVSFFACWWAIGFTWYFQLRHLARMAFSTVAALSMCIFAYSQDTYEVHDIGGKIRVVTTFRRWGQTPLRQSLSHGSGSMSGGLSPTGKRHGQWTITTWETSFDHHLAWYWYGEEVTEGEFRLRDK